MKYAVYCPADQTIQYLSSDRSLTVKHKDALLFSSLEKALKTSEEETIKALESNASRKYQTVPLRTALHCLFSIALVSDEQEFRARPDTWEA